MRKQETAYRFKGNYYGELGVNFRLLDKDLTHKTTHFFDETMAEEAAISCHRLRLDTVRGGSEFRILAEDSFQAIGCEHRVIGMFHVKDIADRVAGAAKLPNCCKDIPGIRRSTTVSTESVS